MKQKIIHFGAILANIALIVFALFVFSEAYGPERWLSLLLMVPPILSLFAICKGPDREERRLAARLRKAHLRKELKSLSEFDG